MTHLNVTHLWNPVPGRMLYRSDTGITDSNPARYMDVVCPDRWRI